jgi:serine/threonine protein kinase
LLQYKTSDSEIKIADFGFAKVAETEHSLKTICGTPGYGEL